MQLCSNDILTIIVNQIVFIRTTMRDEGMQEMQGGLSILARCPN